MKKLLSSFLMLFALILALPFPSQASRPVFRTVTGCVVNGTLYSIRKQPPQYTGPHQIIAYPLRLQNFNLAPYEGKKISVGGYLSPGDRFQADPKTLKVLGPCDRQSRGAILEQSR
jgi:hypothetical protein